MAPNGKNNGVWGKIGPVLLALLGMGLGAFGRDIWGKWEIGDVQEDVRAVEFRVGTLEGDSRVAEQQIDAIREDIHEIKQTQREIWNLLRRQYHD